MEECVRPVLQSKLYLLLIVCFSYPNVYLVSEIKLESQTETISVRKLRLKCVLIPVEVIGFVSTETWFQKYDFISSLPHRLEVNSQSDLALYTRLCICVVKQLNIQMWLSISLIDMSFKKSIHKDVIAKSAHLEVLWSFT